jgi:hypothetical protein
MARVEPSAKGSLRVGQRFAASHQPKAQQALDGLAAVPGLLRDVGGKFAETAATHQQVDRANAEALGSTVERG